MRKLAKVFWPHTSQSYDETIFQTIPISALKSLRGLDYYAAAGSEAFDAVRQVELLLRGFKQIKTNFRILLLKSCRGQVQMMISYSLEILKLT